MGSGTGSGGGLGIWAWIMTGRTSIGFVPSSNRLPGIWGQWHLGTVASGDSICFSVIWGQ